MDDNSIDLDPAIETAVFYAISKNDAKKYAKEILSTVKNNWEEIARKNGLSRAAINYMRPAFHLWQQEI